MNDKQLVQRLHAIKRYFFLESGDLFVHFVDIAGAVRILFILIFKNKKYLFIFIPVGSQQKRA